MLPGVADALGEVRYKGDILPGEQPAIKERALFNAVQQKLTDQWPTKLARIA
jgi:site-specific DNA recombinase